MRRWLAALMCTAALGGCSAGLPDGIDGDLTNHWDPPPRALPWQPINTGCFDDLPPTAGPDDYAPIACTERHVAETYWVGGLTGAAANGPPSAAVTESAAYRECSRRADPFVGGRWRTGRLIIHIVLPNARGWAAGARWFRCDIAESDEEGDPVGRSTSLKLGLVNQPALRLGCFDPTISGQDVRALIPVDCARPHHAEFVGLWAAPRMSLRALANSPRLGSGCRSAIAHYTHVPDDGMLKYRTGWLGFPGGEIAWNAGDRSVQCFLWLSGETMTGSYKNAGTRKLRIHYA